MNYTPELKTRIVLEVLQGGWELGEIAAENNLNSNDYWHTVLPCMGTRKIVVKLRQEGYLIGRKQVRAYMREMGIYAIYPKPNL